MLFYPIISENLVSHTNKAEKENGNKEFDYSKITSDNAKFDRTDTVQEKDFYILPIELFQNVHQNIKSNADLNESLIDFF